MIQRISTTTKRTKKWIGVWSNILAMVSLSISMKMEMSLSQLTIITFIGRVNSHSIVNVGCRVALGIRALAGRARSSELLLQNAS